MRAAILLLPGLLSCAPPILDEPESPSAAVRLLEHSNALRREEGAFRLSLAGGTIPDDLEGIERALAYAEEDTASMRQGISLALEERDSQRMVWRAYHALRAG